MNSRVSEHFVVVVSLSLGGTVGRSRCRSRIFRRPFRPSYRHCSASYNNIGARHDERHRMIYAHPWFVFFLRRSHHRALIFVKRSGFCVMHTHTRAGSCCYRYHRWYIDFPCSAHPQLGLDELASFAVVVMVTVMVMVMVLVVIIVAVSQFSHILCTPYMYHYLRITTAFINICHVWGGSVRCERCRAKVPDMS